MFPDNNDARNSKVLSHIKEKNIQTPLVIANVDRPTVLRDIVLVFPVSWIDLQCYYSTDLHSATELKK